MKVELESTDRIVDLELHGQMVPARVWVGKTAGGVECHAFITRIAVHKDLDAPELEKDLQTAHVALPGHLAGAIAATRFLSVSCSTAWWVDTREL